MTITGYDLPVLRTGPGNFTTSNVPVVYARTSTIAHWQLRVRGRTRTIFCSLHFLAPAPVSSTLTPLTPLFFLFCCYIQDLVHCRDDGKKIFLVCDNQCISFDVNKHQVRGQLLLLERGVFFFLCSIIPPFFIAWLVKGNKILASSPESSLLFTNHSCRVVSCRVQSTVVQDLDYPPTSMSYLDSYVATGGQFGQLTISQIQVFFHRHIDDDILLLTLVTGGERMIQIHLSIYLSIYLSICPSHSWSHFIPG